MVLTLALLVWYRIIVFFVVKMGVAIPGSDEERDTDGGSGVGGDDEIRKKSRATAAILVRTRGPLSS